MPSFAKEVEKEARKMLGKLSLLHGFYELKGKSTDKDYYKPITDKVEGNLSFHFLRVNSKQVEITPEMAVYYKDFARLMELLMGKPMTRFYASLAGRTSMKRLLSPAQRYWYIEPDTDMEAVCSDLLDTVDSVVIPYYQKMSDFEMVFRAEEEKDRHKEDIKDGKDIYCPGTPDIFPILCYMHGEKARGLAMIEEAIRNGVKEEKTIFIKIVKNDSTECGYRSIEPTPEWYFEFAERYRQLPDPYVALP